MPDFVAVLFILMLFIVPIAGFEAGRQFARRRAFQAKYFQGDHKVALQFRNGHFAERLIAYVQRMDEEPI